MLAEIEDKLATIIRQKLTDIPPGNIVINEKPTKPPSITISNLKFKFKKSELSENFDEGKIQFEEKFDGDGVKKSFKLQERPLNKSLCVESPLGEALSQKTDYLVNSEEISIDFKKAPVRGKSNVCVRYESAKNVMTLRTIKVKALYAIDIFGVDLNQADSIGERIVTSLLTAEDGLLADGLEIKPIGGIVLLDDIGKTAKIRLQYVIEKEMQVKEVVGPIEQIEIKGRTVK